VSTVVQFLPELSRWLVDGLDKGQPPAALVQTMIGQRMEPAVAHAIVDEFVRARRAGRPVPVDSIVLEYEAFLREPLRLRAGARVPVEGTTVRVTARCESPALALLADLMSPAECKDLIALARPRLQPSTIVDPATGHDVVAGYRKSVGMFFRPDETPFIARLDRRFAALMNLPPEHGEGIQVLCYAPGGATAPHFDFLLPGNQTNRDSVARSGQRVSTLIAYLADVEAGGETVFPGAGWSVSPQRGHGVYFESSNSRGQLDHRSLHAGQPVLRGEKWIATKWMRQRPFMPAGA
jgi:prolyl 4-hydroxylase